MGPRAGAVALDRALSLLLAILGDAGETPLEALAADLDIPSSTARRVVAAMGRRGLVMRVKPGHFRGGPALAASPPPDTQELLAHAARPVLRKLTRNWSMTAHVGILEQAMVTYVAKENGRVRPIFTREGHQLEAYCSALGKILLAASHRSALDAYLADDPFVALTPHTIIEPGLLRRELDAVRQRGYAMDREEIVLGLRCLAVPLFRPDGSVMAALSVSASTVRFERCAFGDLLADIQRSSFEITRRLYGSARPQAVEIGRGIIPPYSAAPPPLKHSPAAPPAIARAAR